MTITLTMTVMTTYKRNSFYLFIFLVLVGLCYLFPYTSDDWGWAHSSIRLVTTTGTNGRYLGNLVGSIICHSHLIRAVVSALTLFLITWFARRFINNKRPVFFVLGLLVLLSIPKQVFAQAIVWASGLGNYATGSLFLIASLCLLRNSFDNDLHDYPKWMITPSFLFPFLTCFFMEHITTYLVTGGVFFIAYFKLRHKQIPAVVIAWSLGTLAGAICMFLHPSYYTTGVGSNQYRGVAEGLKESNIFVWLTQNYQKLIYLELFQNNTFGNLLVGLFWSILVTNKTGWTKKSHAKNLLSWLFLSILLAYPVYSLIKAIHPEWQILFHYTVCFEAVFSLLFLFSLIIMTGLLIQDRCKRERMLFELFSIIVIILPVCILQPLTSRLIFPAYPFLLIYIMELFDAILPNDHYPTQKTTLFIYSIALCVTFVHLFSVFTVINHYDVERGKYVQTKNRNGAKEILVPRLPYDDYLNDSLPLAPYHIQVFKNYYGLDEDVILKPIHFEDWIEILKQ